MGDLYRHKVRGSTYEVLFEAAKASSIIAALDDMTMVVYKNIDDGQVWVRPAIEFFDGRFERVPRKRIYDSYHGEWMDAGPVDR